MSRRRIPIARVQMPRPMSEVVRVLTDSQGRRTQEGEAADLELETERGILINETLENINEIRNEITQLNALEQRRRTNPNRVTTLYNMINPRVRNENQRRLAALEAAQQEQEENLRRYQTLNISDPTIYPQATPVEDIPVVEATPVDDDDDDDEYEEIVETSGGTVLIPRRRRDDEDDDEPFIASLGRMMPGISR